MNGLRLSPPQTDRDIRDIAIACVRLAFWAKRESGWYGTKVDYALPA